MRDCPTCGIPLHDQAICCNSCGWENPANGKSNDADVRRQFNERMLAASRALPGPSSLDLTDRQWYAVCKFWPKVASRSQRKMVKVGPDQPFDAEVSKGPLLRGFRI